jgi:predicted DNA-binding transcriptional regulator YafY
MSRPATRLLALLELLQSGAQTSGPELARRLQVDGRTLRRYVSRLEELGIPVASEQGCHGGYRLVPGYKLPPLMFTDEEAQALSVGLLAARGLGLDEAAPGLVSAQAKLERVMPASLRRRVQGASETVSLDLPRQAVRASSGMLAALTAAAQSRLRVRLVYRSAQATDSERDLDPYGVAYRGGCWYVVGHCHLRQGLRSFRVDRIRSLRTLAVPFQRPAAFDVLGHLTFSVATLPRTFAVEVLLRTDLATARRQLFETIGVFEQVREGVLLLGQTDDLAWFARQLARLSADFEIRRPVELRREVAALGRRLLASARPNWQS